MSAIFKPRKIAKHLVIQEEARFYRRSRFSLMKFMLGVLLVLMLTGLLLIGADFGLQLLENPG